jgi:predicted DNA repair protein MutK
LFGFNPCVKEISVAGSSLLTLLDDIASVLDDVAAMTKVATKKTAGVLGDDLALNAQQVAGVAVDRELPVVWAVAKGSLLNKVILVPAALAISAFAPWAVIPLLMLGGAFLCYEGFEKLAHSFLLSREERDLDHSDHAEALADSTIDIVAFEKTKIRGAIRTDFILSAEIIAITLGVIAGAPFETQVAVLVGMALIMTIGVYGLVAAIVKIDDVGLNLSKRASTFARRIGRGILFLAPYMMKSLSYIGTAAMFMVGGGILVHGIPGGEDYVHDLAVQAGTVPSVGVVFEFLMAAVINGIVGVIAGAIIVAIVTLGKRMFGRRENFA